LKIALVTTSFPDPEHNYIWAWLLGYLKRGIDLTILTLKINYQTQSNPYFLEKELWRRTRLLNSYSSPFSSLGKTFIPSLSSLWSPKKLIKVVKYIENRGDTRLVALLKTFEYLPCIRDEFDIVHINYPKFAAGRLELGNILGGKTLVSFRGQDLTFFPGTINNVFTESDHLHLISNHLLMEAMKQGYQGGKHSIIPPMVDTNFYAPSTEMKSIKTKDDGYLLFTSARLYWTKGWEFALKAIEILVRRGWNIHYYIAGGGEFKDAVLYTVHDLGITDRVHLLGWLSPQEYKQWMQKADLYLLGSVEEGFNNSVLQAQACGLAAVTSDAGGLPENIEDGVTGLLSRRRDAWDFADKIESLLKQPSKLIEMGKNARVRAVSMFDLDKGIDRFIELYQKML
jgi:colanic acid/amylovoran biosynthesis glycosyltransferase